MLSALFYPFDVIKTNRILGTSFSKEAGNSLPREWTSLYQKGGCRSGLFRGMLMYWVIQKSDSFIYAPTPMNILSMGLLGVLVNPLNVL